MKNVLPTFWVNVQLLLVAGLNRHKLMTEPVSTNLMLRPFMGTKTNKEGKEMYVILYKSAVGVDWLLFWSEKENLHESQPSPIPVMEKSVYKGGRHPVFTAVTSN